MRARGSNCEHRAIIVLKCSIGYTNGRGSAIPYFKSRKARNCFGNAAESSCQVRILHLVLRSVDRTHFMTAYQSSIRSGRLESSRTQKDRLSA